jgi:hypothetical protein
LNYNLSYHADLSDARKINLAAGLLHETALDWFESQRTTLASFQAFTKALEDQFAPFPHSFLAREALEDLRFSTDVATLEHSFRHLLSSCGAMSELEKAHAFMRKLPFPLQVEVKRFVSGQAKVRKVTFNEVVAQAHFEESVLRVAKVQLASTSSSSSPSSSSRRSQPVCYNCGEPGHIRRNCPSKKTAPATKH